MRRNEKRRSGFSMGVALSVLVVVGILLATLSTLFSMEISRARNTRRFAQHQQLLLAGQVYATASLNGGEQEIHPLLPATIPTAGLTITPESKSSDDAIFLISVSAEGTSSHQRVVYHRQASSWRLVSATLVDTMQPATTRALSATQP